MLFKTKEILPYQAVITKIDCITPIQGADKIVAANISGRTCIVNADCKPDMIGVLFTPGTQLSLEYARKNNLFSSSELNSDPAKKGFLAKNRKVTTLTLKGVCSDGLFMPLESLVMQTGDLQFLNLEPNTSFFELIDCKGIKHPVCSRYESYIDKQSFRPKKKLPLLKRIKAAIQNLYAESKWDYGDRFPEHSKTSYFKENNHVILDTIKNSNARITITPKLHGTSARYGCVWRTKEPKGLFKWFKKSLGEYVNIGGSRRVVIGNMSSSGFHGSNSFRNDYLKVLENHLLAGMVVYGEIVGFANNKSIMATHDTSIIKNKEFKKKVVDTFGKTITYSYGCSNSHDAKHNKFYIYRILKTSNGHLVDLSPDEINEFAKPFIKYGVDSVYNYRLVDDLSPEEKLEKVFDLSNRPDEFTRDYIDPSHPNEGVTIRVDVVDAEGKASCKFYKDKSFLFMTLEDFTCVRETDEDGLGVPEEQMATDIAEE